jgi:hypothetical protein
MRVFRDYPSFKVSLTCYLLRLAYFRTYASSTQLPKCLQGSIPGPWLAVTRTGIPPVRICGIAQPLQYATPWREIINGERLARADAGEVKRTANFDRSILIHR